MSKLFILSLSLVTIITKPLEFDLTIRDNKQPYYNIFLEDEINIAENKNFVYSIDLFVGYPAQKFKAVLDTGSNITWVLDKDIRGKQTFDEQAKFECHKSITCLHSDKNITIDYVKGSASGYLVDDIVSFTGNVNPDILSQMTFLPVINTTDMGTEDYNALIGLGKTFDEDKRISILKYYYGNKLINKMVFSLKPTNEKKGKFYLGDIHSDFNNKFAKCSTINTDDHKAYWDCGLSYIIIGDIDYANFDSTAKRTNKHAFIDSGSSMIMAPWTVFPVFSMYFNSHIEEGTCSWHHFKQVVFICKKGIVLEDLPPVYFVLNGYALKIPAKNLFLDHDSFYSFAIQFDSNVEFWILGQPLFKSFHVLFNMEENYIGFQGEYVDVRKFITDANFTSDDNGPYYNSGGYSKLPGILILMGLLILIY